MYFGLSKKCGIEEVVILRSNPIKPDPRIEKMARVFHRAGYRVTAVAWDREGSFPALEKRPYMRIVRLRALAAFGEGLQNLPNLVRWQ